MPTAGAGVVRRILGGVKIGGSCFFILEGLKDALQRQQVEQMEGMRIRRRPERAQKTFYRKARRHQVGDKGTEEDRAELERAAERHGLDEILLRLS